MVRSIRASFNLYLGDIVSKDRDLPDDSHQDQARDRKQLTFDYRLLPSLHSATSDPYRIREANASRVANVHQLCCILLAPAMKCDSFSTTTTDLMTSFQVKLSRLPWNCSVKLYIALDDLNLDIENDMSFASSTSWCQDKRWQGLISINKYRFSQCVHEFSVYPHLRPV